MNYGKRMAAKYSGRCFSCQCAIAVGETITYDGRARHVVCPESTAKTAADRQTDLQAIEYLRDFGDDRYATQRPRWFRR